MHLNTLYHDHNYCYHDPNHCCSDHDHHLHLHHHHFIHRHHQYHHNHHQHYYYYWCWCWLQFAPLCKLNSARLQIEIVRQVIFLSCLLQDPQKSFSIQSFRKLHPSTEWEVRMKNWIGLKANPFHISIIFSTHLHLLHVWQQKHCPRL